MEQTAFHVDKVAQTIFVLVLHIEKGRNFDAEYEIRMEEAMHDTRTGFISAWCWRVKGQFNTEDNAKRFVNYIADRWSEVIAFAHLPGFTLDYSVEDSVTLAEQLIKDGNLRFLVNKESMSLLIGMLSPIPAAY